MALRIGANAITGIAKGTLIDPDVRKGEILVHPEAVPPTPVEERTLTIATPEPTSVICTIKFEKDYGYYDDGSSYSYWKVVEHTVGAVDTDAQQVVLMMTEPFAIEYNGTVTGGRSSDITSPDGTPAMAVYLRELDALGAIKPVYPSASIEFSSLELISYYIDRAAGLQMTPVSGSTVDITAGSGRGVVPLFTTSDTGFADNVGLTEDKRVSIVGLPDNGSSFVWLNKVFGDNTSSDILATVPVGSRYQLVGQVFITNSSIEVINSYGDRSMQSGYYLTGTLSSNSIGWFPQISATLYLDNIVRVVFGEAQVYKNTYNTLATCSAISTSDLPLRYAFTHYIDNGLTGTACTYSISHKFDLENPLVSSKKVVKSHAFEITAKKLDFIPSDGDTFNSESTFTYIVPLAYVTIDISPLSGDVDREPIGTVTITDLQAPDMPVLTCTVIQDY